MTPEDVASESHPLYRFKLDILLDISRAGSFFHSSGFEVPELPFTATNIFEIAQQK
jgi:hypothetical protein